MYGYTNKHKHTEESLAGSSSRGLFFAIKEQGNYFHDTQYANTPRLIFHTPKGLFFSQTNASFHFLPHEHTSSHLSSNTWEKYSHQSTLVLRYTPNRKPTYGTYPEGRASAYLLVLFKFFVTYTRLLPFLAPCTRFSLPVVKCPVHALVRYTSTLVLWYDILHSVHVRKLSYHTHPEKCAAALLLVPSSPLTALSARNSKRRANSRNTIRLGYAAREIRIACRRKIGRDTKTRTRPVSPIGR